MLPAILLCVLVATLSLSLVEPLLHRDRLRAGMQRSAFRERVGAWNAALEALERIESNPVEAGATAGKILAVRGTTEGALKLEQIVLMNRKGGTFPGRGPDWTTLLERSARSGGRCVAWEEVTSSMVSSTRSCKSLILPELGDFVVEGNLDLADSLPLTKEMPGDGVFAVRGSLTVDGELRADGRAGSLIVVVAVGDVRLSSVSAHSAGLAVISLLGRVVVNSFGDTPNLCNSGDATGPRLFFSAAGGLDLGPLSPPGRSVMGCEPELLGPVWPTSALLGRFER